MKSGLLSLFLPFLWTVILRGQSNTSGIINLSSNQVSIKMQSYPHVESYLAVDPNNPRHLIAIAMCFINGKIFSYPYTSFDKGKNWEKGKIIGDSSIWNGGDPVVYIKGKRAYLSTLPEIKNRKYSAITYSDDGGVTWKLSTILPYADRQWMAFAGDRSLFADRIYFTGTGSYTSANSVRSITPFLAWSSDLGLTFPFRKIITKNDANAVTNISINAVPLEPIITSGGLLVLPIQGSLNDSITDKLSKDSLTGRSIGLLVSDDGGETFTAPVYSPYYFKNVTGNAERRFRANSAFGYVRTSIDLSTGKNRNAIYFVSPDYDNEKNKYCIRFWKTSDLGVSWKSTILTSDEKGDIANPAIAVNKDGVIAITWYDRRADPNLKCWQLYTSISVDGGENFLSSIALSNKLTCINQKENWVTFGTSYQSNNNGSTTAYFETGASIPARFPNGGETQGLIADIDGNFHAAWINGETGILQLWYTSFSIDSLTKMKMTRRNQVDKTSPDTISDEMLDITDQIKLTLLESKIDFTNNLYRIKLRIDNIGNQIISEPITLKMIEFLKERDKASGLKNLKVKNADNRETGVGASWIFNTAKKNIAHGGFTETRELLFSFEGGIPDIPEGYLVPGFKALLKNKIK